METFLSVIKFMTNAMIVVSLLQVYLRINKIWKRKHEKEVADSQSIYGLILLFINCLVWIFYYIFIEEDTRSVVDTSIIIMETSAFLLVSTGIFVRGQRRLGFMTLVKQALRLERKEANYLIKRMFKPQNAEVIISILHQLAMIDEDLDEKEKEMIDIFAKEWNIPYSLDKLNKEREAGSEKNFINLRNSVTDYLEREPPKEQVAQFKDMVTAMIHADEKVTQEEELISAEINGLIDNFLSKDQKAESYHVIIVPQNPEHENQIAEMIPGATQIRTAGGVAYSVGLYFSHKYAEMICRQFRKYKLFTIVYSIEQLVNGQESA